MVILKYILAVSYRKQIFFFFSKTSLIFLNCHNYKIILNGGADIETQPQINQMLTKSYGGIEIICHITKIKLFLI